MDIDVTRLVRDADCAEFSGSIAERGPNAGPETWQNAKEEAADSPLLKRRGEIDEARAYFGEFGAWTRKELAAMSAAEINALVIQYVSGDIREAQELCPDSESDDGIDWPTYEKLAEDGRIRGSLFPYAGGVWFSLWR